MYEFIKVRGNSYYIESPSKIGVYVDKDKKAWFIDSGNNSDAGKKAKRIIEENGFAVGGIINTHAHADHTGGNQYIQKHTGCRAYLRGAGVGISKYPILMPSLLYGAMPHSDLKHKFLLAEESDSYDIDLCRNEIPEELEIIDLDGHWFGMIGIKTPDNVVYLADSFCSEYTVGKYAMTYIYDIKRYLETLSYIENSWLSDDYIYVSSHTEVFDKKEKLSAIIDVNRKKVNEITDLIISLLSEKQTSEELLRKIFIHYSLAMNAEQHALLGSTLRSYLTYLREKGAVGVEYEDNYEKFFAL